MKTVNLVGQVLTPQLKQKLQEERGIRIIEPACGYTEEFCPWRTNLVLDENNVVVKIFQG